ncbi:MAG: hypothetical protein HRT45_14140 [Bdellovibrionales bacterium]|nr:hypothetical protein [Bdellovibrionales bacterium]
MFSNRTSSLLVTLWVSICLVLAACAGDNQPQGGAPEVALGKGQSECLSGADRTLELFIQGDLEDREVRSFYNCLDSVVTTFLSNTKGRGSGRNYTPTQIFKFLKDFFFGELQVPLSLRAEIMQIKRLLVGGDVDLITRAELERVREILGVLENISVRMNRHTKVLYEAFNAGPSVALISTDRMELAIADIDKAIMELSDVFSERGETYSETQLRNLLFELHTFIYDGDADPNDWVKYLPAVWDTKRILLSSTRNAAGEEIFAGDQWPQLMKIVSRGVNGWLRAWFFVFKSGEFGDERSVYHLDKIKQSAVQMLLTSLQRHEGQVIRFGLFDALIEDLDREIDFPIGITGEGAKDLVRKLVRLALTPMEQRPEANQPQISGWSRSHVLNMQTELDVWLDDQRAAARFLSDGNTEQFQNSELGRGAISLWNFQLDDKNRVQFRWGRDALPYDMRSLTQLNWKKMVIRLVLRTWATDPERRDTLDSLTPLELEQAQLDLWPIGEGLNLWNRGEVQLAQRVVREANLFMPRADGGSNVNFEEGVEYFAYVMSGLGAKDFLREDIKKHCDLVDIDEDTDGFDVSCFRDNSYQYLNRWFGHAPYLLNYLHQKENAEDADDKRWKTFLKFLEETAVAKDENGEVKIYAQGDIMIMWILCQYIETFFARFDEGGVWGEIEIDEALTAYGTYNFYMTQLPGLNWLSDFDRLALFTYMMKFGDIPILGDGLGGGIRFIWWKLRRNKWQTDADRIRIVKILAALNKAQSQFILRRPESPKFKPSKSK